MSESIVKMASQHIESKINEGSIAFVKSDTIALLSELRNVNEMLVGAEGQTGLSTSHEVSPCVDELRRIAYEAEDEVDTLVSSSSSSSLSSLLSFKPWDNRASKKLRELKGRTRKVKTKLDEHAQGPNKEIIPHPRGSRAPTSHHHADGDHVIGIEPEITSVIKMLTRKSELNSGQEAVDKLAIVGMGGSGKTTLARSIYTAVKKHFPFRVWVSVSQDWDTSVVLLDIANQIRDQQTYFKRFSNNDARQEHDPEKLIFRIKNLLNNKKTCLLVLDDVWDIRPVHEFFTLIHQNDDDFRPFKMVITSRRIPSKLFNWCIHQRHCLTDDDSRKLLGLVANRSLRTLSVEYHPTAVAMLKKSQGLPLAVVALGTLLKTKNAKGLSSEITVTESTSIYDQVKEDLELSYDELPHYLKPCFLYLGIFPEGSVIPVGNLIRMWIAEGFVKGNKVGHTLEAVGRKYLQELVDHTMVEVVTRCCSGNAKSIRLHRMMREFCILEARGLDFLTVLSSKPEAIEEKSRRAAINLRPCSNINNLVNVNSNLRSLALFKQGSTSVLPENSDGQRNQRSLDMAGMCERYKLLRILDIFGIEFPNGSLPKEIGNLVHLAYLRIKYTNIRVLPNSIGKLRNLLTLDYRQVSGNTEVVVPNVLWKLEKLRHLYLPGEMISAVSALQLDTLKDLITLWGVGGGYWMVKEMGKIKCTLGKLYIHGMSTEGQLNAVLGCPAVKNNSSLYALVLDWYNFDFNNLGELSAIQSLQKLKLRGRARDKAHPQGLQFPSNLRKLELYYTKLETQETMSLLGRLAFLKVLNLSMNSYMGNEWSCSKEAFPVLEEFKLADLPNLEKWEIEEGAFRLLKKLSIVSCINLKGMPEGVKLVPSLEILDIERMPSNFNSRLQEVKRGKGGEDFNIIKHIPRVRFQAHALHHATKSKEI